MKSSDYWQKRFVELERTQHNIGAECYNHIEKQYRLAQNELESQIAVWYQRFAKNNDVTMEEARKMLNKKELAELKWNVQEYIKHGKENAVNEEWMKQLENASAQYHINRLEALKLQMRQSMENLFSDQQKTIDGTMRKVYKTGYYHTAYEIQKGVGVGWDLAKIDDRKIRKVINKPWAADGKNFSERIWGNRQKLINEMNTTLTQNIILGQDPQKAIDAIAKKLNTSKVNAGRLVMTEEAFFSSAAQKDCFNELDVEQFEVVATLDSNTSEICQEMDGKRFPMSQWEVGVTAPPFHVNCRSTTVPYDPDFDDDVGMRAARDEETGKTYYVPENMTYKEWEKAFVQGDKSGAIITKNNADFMGKAIQFANARFKVKAYEVTGKENICTQTNTRDAQNTIEFVDQMQREGIVKDVSRIAVIDDLPGIAAYDHKDNVLYVNEKLTNKEFLHTKVLTGHFVAENPEEVIKHEMYHKKHWDFIMTKGENHATIKHELEEELHKYVSEQMNQDHRYIKRVVSVNAHDSFCANDSLNELIADALLKNEKGTMNDKTLIKLVRRCVE